MRDKIKKILNDVNMNPTIKGYGYWVDIIEYTYNKYESNDILDIKFVEFYKDFAKLKRFNTSIL